MTLETAATDLLYAAKDNGYEHFSPELMKALYALLAELEPEEAWTYTEMLEGAQKA